MRRKSQDTENRALLRHCSHIFEWKYLAFFPPNEDIFYILIIYLLKQLLGMQSAITIPKTTVISRCPPVPSLEASNPEPVSDLPKIWGQG